MHVAKAWSIVDVPILRCYHNLCRLLILKLLLFFLHNHTLIKCEWLFIACSSSDFCHVGRKVFTFIKAIHLVSSMHLSCFRATYGQTKRTPSGNYAFSAKIRYVCRMEVDSITAFGCHTSSTLSVCTYMYLCMMCTIVRLLFFQILPCLHLSFLCFPLSFSSSGLF